MILQSALVFFYIASAYLLFLTIKNLSSILKISWKTPLRITKLCFYAFSSVYFFLIAHGLSSFYSFEITKPILEIQIDYLENQYYEVKLISPGSNTTEKSYKVHGDMWQVDLKILTWKPLLNYLSIKPLYSLERLNGRYTKLEDEFNKARSVYQFNKEDATQNALYYRNA